MTTFEQIQRQLWDSLMDHERRVFLRLIQDELPTLTLRELGQILTSPAARSVGALPASALFGAEGDAPPPPAVAAPAALAAKAKVKAKKLPRRARVAAAESVQSTPAAPGPRTRPEPAVAAPQSPISADPDDDDDDADEALEPPAPARPLVLDDPSAAPRRSSAPLVSQRAFAPPTGDRSNVDVVRSAMNRTLAQHNRFDPDSLVINALRTTGAWIRARDLRPQVGLQPDDLRAVLNRLVKAGAIRREGEGPDTVYQVMSGA